MIRFLYTSRMIEKSKQFPLIVISFFGIMKNMGVTEKHKSEEST